MFVKRRNEFDPRVLSIKKHSYLRYLVWPNMNYDYHRGRKGVRAMPYITGKEGNQMPNLKIFPGRHPFFRKLYFNKSI